jgi:hypothetical protein
MAQVTPREACALVAYSTLYRDTGIVMENTACSRVSTSPWDVHTTDTLGAAKSKTGSLGGTTPPAPLNTPEPTNSVRLWVLVGVHHCVHRDVSVTFCSGPPVKEHPSLEKEALGSSVALVITCQITARGAPVRKVGWCPPSAVGQSTFMRSARKTGDGFATRDAEALGLWLGVGLAEVDVLSLRVVVGDVVNDPVIEPEVLGLLVAVTLEEGVSLMLPVTLCDELGVGLVVPVNVNEGVVVKLGVSLALLLREGLGVPLTEAVALRV